MAGPENAHTQDPGILGSLRRHWRALLRVFIYGLLGGFILIIPMSLYFPITEPAAVRRVAAGKKPGTPISRSASKTPPKTKPSSEIAATSTTLAAPAVKTELRLDGLTGKMMEFVPLFPNMRPDDYKTSDAARCLVMIQQRIRDYRRQVEAIDQVSQTQDYAAANQYILDLKSRLRMSSYEVGWYEYYMPGHGKNPPQWALEGRGSLYDLEDDLLRRELDHYVRHGHWITAAKFCEYHQEYTQAIYYWRKAGGYDGRLRCVIGGLSIPIQILPGMRSAPAYGKPTISDKLYFVKVPAEDEEMFYSMNHSYHSVIGKKQAPGIQEK